MDVRGLSAGRRPTWSKGTAAHCDFRGPTGYDLAPTEDSCQPEAFFREHYRRAHGLVWIRLSTRARDGKSCDLDHFVRGALPSIRKPFALVTTDGDVNVPSELRPETVTALLNSPYLAAWRSQNYDGAPHPKLGPFPVGLDLHTPRLDGGPEALAALLQKTRRERPPIGMQPLRVFSDVNFNLNSEDRHLAVSQLRDAPCVDFLGSRVSPEEIWRRYASSPFVLSVMGNGRDCHRTWDSLYLGSIVITKHSALDPLFSGLPVALVDDWDEVRDESRLAAWRARYAPLTGRSRILRRLDPEAWLRPIRELVTAGEACAKAQQRRRPKPARTDGRKRRAENRKKTPPHRNSSLRSSVARTPTSA